AARKLEGMPAVDEDDPRPLSPRERAGVRAVRKPDFFIPGDPERPLRDRRRVRVPPGLVLRGRQPRREEPLEPGASDPGQPRRLALETTLGEAGLARRVEVVDFDDGFHQDTETRAGGGSFSTQA